VLARKFCADWRRSLVLVSPDTQSCAGIGRAGGSSGAESRSRGGRPHLSPEERDLITTISRGNWLWGTERIRGELLKLGIVVSNRSIRRYRWRGPMRSPSQT